MSRTEQLNRIELLLERLDAAVVVREPGNARSAEMFDGLRKQVIQSGKNHRTHVAHLLSLVNAIDKGADVTLIRERLGDFLNELGIEQSSDTSRVDFFDVVEGDGPMLECIEPAVVERIDGSQLVLVRAGKARRVPSPVVEEPVASEPATAPTEVVQSIPEVTPPKRGGWFKRKGRTPDDQPSQVPVEVTPEIPTEPQPAIENGEDDGRNRN
jgi:hypothetical protein